MGVRVCPAGYGHCCCSTPYCPTRERRIADGLYGQWAPDAKDRQELARRRLARPTPQEDKT